jgi:hypothetical protein
MRNIDFIDNLNVFVAHRNPVYITNRRTDRFLADLSNN